MPTFRYSSAGNNQITFANQDDPDNTFRVGAVRSWTDSAKNVRFNRLSFVQTGFQYVSKPGCDDGCLTSRSTRTFSTKIDCPAPKSETERNQLIADYKAHHNNVLKGLEEYNVAGGTLPPASAEFNGTYTPTP